MQTLWQDLRYGARMLRKTPGFTLVAVVVIALGVSANTTIFSGVNATLLHPFSYPNEPRLVVVHEQKLATGVERNSVAPGNLTEWRAHNQTLQDLVAMTNDDVNLSYDGQPDRYSCYLVSASFFETLGVSAALGRTFVRGEDEPGRERIVVLRHAFWVKRFGADPNLIGREILINNQPNTVVGVMPEHFDFPYGGGEFWMPLVITPEAARDHASHYLRVIGLLKPQVTVAQAHTDLLGIAQRLQTQFPESNTGATTFVNGLTADYTRGAKTYLPIMIGAAFFVLLIACANVANLMLARGAARHKEIALRLALGAQRWQIIRQLLYESIMLALMGGVLGVVLSAWGNDAMAGAIPENMSKFIPGWHQLGINRQVLWFTLAVSMLTGLLFGLAPAWQATKADLNETLKLGGKQGGSGAARNGLRHALVVAEIALSLVLLVGAGLLVRSFIHLLNTDLGVKPDNVLTLSLALPEEQYATAQQRRDFYDRLLTSIRNLPGVSYVGTTNDLPFSGRNWLDSTFSIEGRPAFERGKEPLAATQIISPDYFNAVGMALRQGRGFTARDDESAPRVALVNEAFAEKYFPGQSARQSVLGQRLKLSGDDRALEIVGITANVMNNDIDSKTDPYIYQPFAQRVRGQNDLAISATTDATSLTAAIRQQVAALDPLLPLSQVKSLRQRFDERSSPKRVVTGMMTIFALMALLMAAVGTYAVMAYAVSQRTNEFGIRLALGAQTRDILLLVMKRGLRLTAIGVAIGLLGALALSRALSQFLYGVTPTDALTFGGVAVLLGGAALLACYLPARKATKVDPMIALRYE